jgi:Mg/Co/Ni transporter MgtE
VEDEMAAAKVDAIWFEATPHRRLDGGLPVSRLMTTSAEAAALDARWPRLPSVSAIATVHEAAHLMASRGLRQVQVRGPRGEIVGVLSVSDLFRWVAGGTDDAGEA